MNKALSTTIATAFVAASAVLLDWVPLVAAALVSGFANVALWIGVAGSAAAAFLRRSEGMAGLLWGLAFLTALGLVAAAALFAWDSLGLFGQVTVVGVPVAALALSIATEEAGA